MISSINKRVDALMKILNFPKVKDFYEDWDSMSQDAKRDFLEGKLKNLKELDGLTECGVGYFLPFFAGRS